MTRSVMLPTMTWTCASQIAPADDECPCEHCELKRRAAFNGPWESWDETRRDLGLGSDR